MTNINRREYLNRTAAFTSVLAWHSANLSFGEGSYSMQDTSTAPDAGKVRFTALRLQATRLEEMRCTLLKDSTGADELYFSKWNAHAVYFADPAGNIGELIARHTLANAASGSFDVDDTLYASEIGLVTPDPKAFGTELGSRFGLPGGGSMFVGDPSGYFVLPPVDRLWIPEEKQKATIFPAEVTLAINDKVMEYRPKDLPYAIRTAGQ